MAGLVGCGRGIGGFLLCLFSLVILIILLWFSHDGLMVDSEFVYVCAGNGGRQGGSKEPCTA